MLHKERLEEIINDMVVTWGTRRSKIREELAAIRGLGRSLQIAITDPEGIDSPVVYYFVVANDGAVIKMGSLPTPATCKAAMSEDTLLKVLLGYISIEEAYWSDRLVIESGDLSVDLRDGEVLVTRIFAKHLLPAIAVK